MRDWTAGYVADIAYTFGYYTELSPLRVNLAFLNAGLVPPRSGTACELGFGQGMSLNLHAAAGTEAWYGTDFNPAHAGFAQELAEVSGASARICDDAFADFAQRTDVPEFDYIGIHGIWSWISDANRAVIVDFVARKLKVGGVLYISYNTLPGWAAFAPIRHLLTLHAATLGSEGKGIVSRIDGALDFADQLLAVDPAYASSHPQVVGRLRNLREQDRHYLAHEYFNRDWLPMHFATMAQWLSPAKLDYACSANYLDHVDAVDLTPTQQEFVNGISDIVLRETARDFMVNRQFRKDYWVRGARKLDSVEQGELLRAQKIILTVPRAEISLKISGAQEEVEMIETIYNPILDEIANHQPKTLAEIELAVAQHGIGFGKVRQAVLILGGSGQLLSVQADAAINAARPHTDRLNAYLMRKARGSDDIGYLASPVTAGGVTVGRIELLFLLARLEGMTNPADWAKFVWEILEVKNQALVKDGIALDNAEDNIAELTVRADAFNDTRVPILRALQIVVAT
jgi:SAM-dependent methyltransferase